MRPPGGREPTPAEAIAASMRRWGAGLMVVAAGLLIAIPSSPPKAWLVVVFSVAASLFVGGVLVERRR